MPTPTPARPPKRQRPRRSAPPSIAVVVGSSGSGKTAWVKREVADAPRLLVWDVVGDWGAVPGAQVFTDRGALVAALAKGSGRYIFQPKKLQWFDWWARVALAWGRCAAVAEELADVTTPGKAPEGWGQLIRRGRHAGVRVYAITQRPAESDKTVMGNATRYLLFFLKRPGDRAYMARETGLDVAALDALRPLEFLDVDAAGHARPVSRLTF